MVGSEGFKELKEAAEVDADVGRAFHGGRAALIGALAERGASLVAVFEPAGDSKTTAQFCQFFPGCQAFDKVTDFRIDRPIADYPLPRCQQSFRRDRLAASLASADEVR